MSSATFFNDYLKDYLENEERKIESVDIEENLNTAKNTNSKNNERIESKKDQEQEENEFKKFKSNKSNNFLIKSYWIVTSFFSFLEIIGLFFWLIMPRGGPLFPGPISGPPKPRVIPTWKDYAEEAFYFFPLNISAIFSYLANLKIIYCTYVYLSFVYTAVYCYFAFHVLFTDGISGAAMVVIFLIVKCVCISTSMKIKKYYFK